MDVQDEGRLIKVVQKSAVPPPASLGQAKHFEAFQRWCSFIALLCTLTARLLTNYTINRAETLEAVNIKVRTFRNHSS